MCPKCRHQGTNQRLVDVSLVNRDPRIARAEIQVQQRHNKPPEPILQIIWRGDGQTEEGHQSKFALKWLWEHSPTGAPIPVADQILWTSAIRENPPLMEFQEVTKNKEGLLKWLEMLSSYGIL